MLIFDVGVLSCSLAAPDNPVSHRKFKSYLNKDQGKFVSKNPSTILRLVIWTKLREIVFDPRRRALA